MILEYLVFSDESGRWNDGDYYIRSWIKIARGGYNDLRKELIYLKHETGIKEIKWDKVKKQLKNIRIRDTFKALRNIEYSVFISISIPSHFQERIKTNHYRILRTLEDIGPEKSTGGTEFSGTLKRKIISSARHTIFFHMYEKIHIENAIRALKGDDPRLSLRLIVDSPQCITRDWFDIAKECGHDYVSTEKESETNSGIEIADVIAGCLHECLRGDEPASTFYREYIKPKMEDMYSKSYPNPNMIFFKDFSEEEKKKINIFR